MRKSVLRLERRKTLSLMVQLIGLFVLLVVGSGFYITLFTISERYEQTAEQFFKDQAYADFTLYGNFSEKSVELAEGQDGVKLARGRTVRDYHESDGTLRAISLTDGVNIPYLYEGRLPRDSSECLMLRRNAEAMGYAIGDKLTLGGVSLTISGLAASAEYVYLVQNERIAMAQAERFGVVYVHQDFFSQGYNEILVLTTGGAAFPEDADIPGLSEISSRVEQTNHALYRSDLDEIKSFAYIFPLVFAALIAVVIYVILKRSVHKDRRQLGTMMALGMPDRHIVGVYLTPFCLTAVAGSLAGGGAAVFLCDTIIGIFASMFEVPTLGFAFYWQLWLLAVVISTLLCLGSGLIALRSVLSLSPALALRPQAPSSTSKIPRETPGVLWHRLSFNTRYALKSSVRNKGRFLAVVLGMCGSCALMTFSLGFYNSMDNTKNQYFDHFARYDVIVSVDPVFLKQDHPVMDHMDESRKALMIPVKILDESYPLVIVDEDFDMLAIPQEALGQGVIIPEYFANEWGVQVGDKLDINGHEAVISAVNTQYLGLTLYTGYEYIRLITDDVPEVYTMIFGTSSNMARLRLYLSENELEFSTIDDDRTSFDLLLENMSVLIWLLIGCSIVLGVTVLYSVGLINLSAREYEYMFLGVMGYPKGSILMAHVKEAVLQLVLAIPLGFALGRLLLEAIKGEFSGNSIVISTAIYPQSHLISLVSVLVVTTMMVFVTSRHIGKLNIVEGLKVQGE